MFKPFRENTKNEMIGINNFVVEQYSDYLLSKQFENEEENK